MGLRQPAVNPFQAQREKAVQRADATAQASSDALKRRFASMGNMNSGAAVKSEQLARDQANQQKEEAIAGVNAAESQDIAQKQEMQANRDFQSNEAKMGRDFQSTEAQKARTFQKGESDMDRAFQDKVFQFDSNSKLRQLDLADKQFALGKDESEFNKRVARRTLGQQGGLLGGGGFLGLGIDTKDADV